MTVRIQTAPFDASAETAALTAGRTDIGAVVSFTGLCRGDDGLVALTLDCYVEMAEAEIARLVEAARARWPLHGVTVIHRYGRLLPGEPIVLVAAASAHRAAAFAAAEFLMDYLKTRAPFWKKEERAAGSSLGRGHGRGRRRRGAVGAGALTPGTAGPRHPGLRNAKTRDRHPNMVLLPRTVAARRRMLRIPRVRDDASPPASSRPSVSESRDRHPKMGPVPENGPGSRG